MLSLLVPWQLRSWWWRKTHDPRRVGLERPPGRYAGLFAGPRRSRQPHDPDRGQAEKGFPQEVDMIPYVFVRAEGFYIVELRDDADARANAECNPGTLRVEDMRGNVVWQQPAKH